MKLKTSERCSSSLHSWQRLGVRTTRRTPRARPRTSAHMRMPCAAQACPTSDQAATCAQHSPVRVVVIPLSVVHPHLLPPPEDRAREHARKAVGGL